MTTLQEYINKKDKNTKSIYIDDDDDFLKAVDTLDLSEFKQVEKVHIDGWGSPFFKKINLKECSELKELILVNNGLTDLNFLTEIPNPTKLTELRIGHRIKDLDLTILERFANLEKLNIKEDSSYMSSNEFLYDEKKLRKLTKLRELNGEIVNPAVFNKPDGESRANDKQTQTDLTSGEIHRLEIENQRLSNQNKFLLGQMEQVAQIQQTPKTNYN